MSISHWPASERPREKLLEKGGSALSDAELLAIFFRTGIAGKTAVDMARETLAQFGSLRKLVEAGPDAFCSVPGLGPAKYVQIQAALELGERCMKEKLHRGDVLSNPAQTKDFLMMRMRSYQQEVFACLFLDSQNRVITFDEMFFGTINAASVYCREVVKRGLERNAASVIFAHNHPSGVAEPSAPDEQITRQLVKSLNLVDIKVLDHIVVGDGVTVSFAERGLLR
ncbi:MAG: DNA repair protein RadC [Gammaproteobacteria bacterium]|nr:DNA repair protein RadC [Gammaproteobacteria bacterium]